jgi:hypothetical protein
LISTAPSGFRPLTLAQILDQAIRLYRNNFLRFVGIMAVVQLPVTIFQIIAATFTNNSLFGYLSEAPGVAPIQDQEFMSAYFLGLGASLLTALASFILVQVVGNAALTRAVADSRAGASTGILEAFGKTGRAWPRLLGALLLAGLLSILLLVWWMVPCIGWLTGGGMLAFLGMALVPLLAPVVVLEASGPASALLRAWDLARRRFWWLLGFMFVLYLFSQLVVGGPAMLVSMLSAAMMDGSQDPTTMALTNALTQAGLSLLMSLIYLPLQTCAVTLAYLDLRVRTEGLDLALQSAAAASPDGAALDIASVPASPPPRGFSQMFESKDLANFAIITIAFVGLYILIIGAFFILGMAAVAAFEGGGF